MQLVPFLLQLAALVALNEAAIANGAILDSDDLKAAEGYPRRQRFSTRTWTRWEWTTFCDDEPCRRNGCGHCPRPTVRTTVTVIPQIITQVEYDTETQYQSYPVTLTVAPPCNTCAAPCAGGCNTCAAPCAGGGGTCNPPCAGGGGTGSARAPCGCGSNIRTSCGGIIVSTPGTSTTVTLSTASTTLTVIPIPSTTDSAAPKSASFSHIPALLAAAVFFNFM